MINPPTSTSMPKVLAGSFKILQNQVELLPSVLSAIQNVQVQDEINMPAMFSFTLNFVSPNLWGETIDLDTFKPGDQITILLGLEKMKKMISGEISAIEPSFSTSCSMTVRGFDRMYRLKFGTRTRAYQGLDDNAIVEQVARDAGLRVDTRGQPGTINKHLVQHKQTNYDFLMQRCEEINYELLMDDTVLVFRPSGAGQSAQRTFRYPADISQVDLNLKVPTLGDQVTVVGYDIEANQVISAEASSGSPRDKMGGQQNGYGVAQDFPDSGITLERPNITSVEALQEVAQAQYERNLNNFISGSASMVGDPALSAGINIKLTGLSKRFDGTYYITSSTHSCDRERGYQTDVVLRRTGL
jgi:phage protein D